MDTLKQNTLVILVSVVLALFGAWFLGVGGTNTETVTREVVKEIQKGQPLGALSSPNISSPYLSWGDMTTYRSQTVLTNATAATNTPCILTSPAATSTLRFAALRVSTASSTATGWHVSKGTGTSEATTTANSLGSYALGASTLGTMTLRPALSTVDPVSVFAPNSKLVWTIAGTAIADTTKFNGVCQAEWDVL